MHFLCNETPHSDISFNVLNPFSRSLNNNECLECLTCTGPKRLHVLYKYILSKFSAYNMNTHTHVHTHTQTESIMNYETYSSSC